MGCPTANNVRKSLIGMMLLASLSSLCRAQVKVHYEPTLESLNRHPLPQWYADAKLGIFVHWGLYSVPGWAPLSHPEHDFRNVDYIKNNPYAEWYYNVMRIDGSPTQAYHRQHYGGADYYNFVPVFNQESAKWKPDQWAEIFHNAGAKYVVLTTKHHDGFTLWPSSIKKPHLRPDQSHSTRDLVGDLARAVRQDGMKMGVYYSGLYDWSFGSGPFIADDNVALALKQQGSQYPAYADAQLRELIGKY